MKTASNYTLAVFYGNPSSACAMRPALLGRECVNIK